MSKVNVKNFLIDYVWLLCFVIGGIGTVVSWIVFPHNREQGSLLQYSVHILVFIIILSGISFFPNKINWLFVLLVIPILVFNLFLAPKLTFFAEHTQYENFYNLFFVILYPLFLCSICLAYRLGGGKSGNCLKIGLIGVLVLFSGVMDFMWFILNGYNYAVDATSIPHIQVVIGHVPKFVEIIVFISVHFAASIALVFVPLDKFFDKLTKVQAA
jgi:hypothetical protein